ncbi:MAG: hypothetical protein ACC645_14845, partial [Pirellulales bacterium]
EDETDEDEADEDKTDFVRLSVGKNPKHLVAADIDDDGFIDELVTSNADTNNVSVLSRPENSEAAANNGGWSRQDFGVGAAPEATVDADFDEDGIEETARATILNEVVVDDVEPIDTGGIAVTTITPVTDASGVVFFAAGLDRAGKPAVAMFDEPAFGIAAPFRFEVPDSLRAPADSAWRASTSTAGELFLVQDRPGLASLVRITFDFAKELLLIGTGSVGSSQVFLVAFASATNSLQGGRSLSLIDDLSAVESKDDPEGDGGSSKMGPFEQLVRRFGYGSITIYHAASEVLGRVTAVPLALLTQMFSTTFGDSRTGVGLAELITGLAETLVIQAVPGLSQPALDEEDGNKASIMAGAEGGDGPGWWEGFGAWDPGLIEFVQPVLSQFIDPRPADLLTDILVGLMPHPVIDVLNKLATPDNPGSSPTLIVTAAGLFVAGTSGLAWHVADRYRKGDWSDRIFEGI